MYREDWSKVKLTGINKKLFFKGTYIYGMCIYICVSIYMITFPVIIFLILSWKKKGTANKTKIDSKNITTTTENNTFWSFCIYSIMNQITSLKETLQLSVYAKPQ